MGGANKVHTNFKLLIYEKFIFIMCHVDNVFIM